MALPNNRRIFDMAAHAWKQAKTILTVPPIVRAGGFGLQAGEESAVAP